MKKTTAFLFLLAALLAAENAERGIPLSITLVSGASNRAEYLGSENDTLFFGGFIADTFTVIKLQKARIRELRDSAGNPLSFARADSILEEFRAKIAEDSLQTQISTDSLPKPADLSGKSLIFPVFRRPIDSALAARIYDLEFQVLGELGENPWKASPENFPKCEKSPCIENEAKARGAKAVWTSEIKPSRHQDSLDIFIHRLSLETGEQKTERLTVSARFATGELLRENRFLSWIQKAKGIQPSEKKVLPGIVSVETYPEEANLSRKGGDVICQTPCAFPVADTGKVELEAYWNVENTLWANKATVRPVPGDTTRIVMHLKRVKPEVEIRTVPSGAKIFGETEILPGSRPIGQTPKTLFSGEPGMASVHLWKEGFRDSVVEFYVNATTRTLLEINLTPISSPEERKAQEVFQTIQRRMFWGHLALGCAIAPAIAGGIFLYMSEKDRDKAKNIKKELEMPSSGNGKNFRALVRKNHHYADRSKGERYVGAGFLLVAGGLLATGIVLSF